MITDESRAIDIVTSALLHDLESEVDIIFRFGSVTRGTTHRYSDLDVAYVPAHESTWKSITVLVDDTLLDLFPMHWPWLERLATFEDVRCSIILEGEIIYARDEATAARWQGLRERLKASLEPDKREEMLSKAQTTFQKAAYPYYLLRQMVAERNQIACLYHARTIRDTVLHSVVLANQRVIDTRKLEQLRSLPRRPVDFETNLRWISDATDPDDILAATEALMASTRAMLVAEQAEVQRESRPFAEVLDSAYPELRGDILHIVLACDRQDMYGSTLTSLYHELMIHMARALTGIQYSSFNSLAEYEQDLEALGFPALLPYLEARDYEGLRAACGRFDERLRSYLTEQRVGLNAFASLDELEAWLAS